MFSSTLVLNPAAGVMRHFIPDKGVGSDIPVLEFFLFWDFAHISEKPP